MIEIDWVQIPEGEFQFGLSDEQRDTIRDRLRAEIGLDRMQLNTQQIVEGLVEKYRRTAREEEYSVNEDMTAEERQIDPEWDDPLFSYLLAEAELERIPSHRRLWIPAFYIARFPITHAQADAFFDSNYAQWRGLYKLRVLPGEDLADMPEEMKWTVADATAHWLGGRLPSVVEWEKAARGTDGFLYPWGNDWDPARGNFDFGHRPEYSQTHSIWRAVVDAYPGGVSPYGVWDMLGNLAEWTITRTVPKVKGSSEYPWSKGESVKTLGMPGWFWSIAARQHPGSRNVGCRPILSYWQRQFWLGVSVPSNE